MGPIGIQVEFKSIPGVELAFESLASERSKDGAKNIELLNVVTRENCTYATVFVPDGKLEKIVNDKEHRSRPALIWKNLFFSLSNRKTLEMPTYMLAVNSPLYLHPEVIELVSEYVFIPGDVKKAYAEAAKKQEAP